MPPPKAIEKNIFFEDGSQGVKDGFAGDALMVSHSPQNAVQRAHAQVAMVGHGQTMMGGFLGLQNNVTTHLMHNLVTPVPAQSLDQFPAAKVSRNFHAGTRTSSLIR